MEFHAQIFTKTINSLFLIIVTKIVDLVRIVVLKCVDEGGEDEDAHGEKECEHTKLFVAVLY